MKNVKDILQQLPYEHPFLFVDTINKINDKGCEGTYFFKDDLPFYRGHFKDSPVTPGVILTECCAQIGVVCLGIYLMGKTVKKAPADIQIAMSSVQMEFLTAVYPNEKVRVISEKIYYRFSKLKCKVSMYNSRNEVICKGTISGMFKIKENA